MILCLDIAFANTGWAVMDKGVPAAYGTIRTEKDKRKSVRVSDDKAFRAGKMAEELKEVIELYTPLGIIAELPHGSQNASAANLLGWAAGVVVSMATAYGIPCEWISEGDSKLAAIGRRTATKDEMMQWARNRWPEIEFPKAKTHFEHVADSLAAYHGLRHGILVRTFG